MKVLCGDARTGLDDLGIENGIAVSLLQVSNAEGTGRVGANLPSKIRQAGLSPNSMVWDFLALALAVTAADHGILRRTSADGWTRQIDLRVAMVEPAIWRAHADKISMALGFLTGDLWSLEFVKGGVAPLSLTARSKSAPTGDTVCLLSGGLDSLVGGIDLVAAGKRPIFVSQVSQGDADKQRNFAKALGNGLGHIQLSHAAYLPGVNEKSQRARSMIFLAYGLLAATCISAAAGKKVKLVVPENGFISLNVPMTKLRIGSLSTRTTHPYFIRLLQQIFDAIGINVLIENPYQYLTKGEILDGCLDQQRLQQMAFTSTSCGRFGRFGYEHCGRCVPCLVRRSAIAHWSAIDSTRYRYPSLTGQKGFDDVRSVAMACLKEEQQGVEAWAGNAISHELLNDIPASIGVAKRGIDELRAFLTVQGAF